MNIVPRAAWARERWGQLSPMSLPARRLWVHHGAGGSPDLATLRAYERYHVQNRGWAGLGYSFAIVGDGTVYEGRGTDVGAHTKGDNTASFGVVLVGDWTRLAPPRPMVEALADLTLHLAGRRLLNAAAITGGHRDAPGATTVCPGNGGMQAVVEARRLIIDRLNSPTCSEDIVATIDELRTVVREENRLVRERTNEAVRLAREAVRGEIARLRAEAGLEPDAASDDVWVGRLRDGSHTLADAAAALRRAAR